MAFPPAILPRVSPLYTQPFPMNAPAGSPLPRPGAGCPSTRKGPGTEQASAPWMSADTGTARATTLGLGLGLGLRVFMGFQEVSSDMKRDHLPLQSCRRVTAEQLKSPPISACNSTRLAPHSGCPPKGGSLARAGQAWGTLRWALGASSSCPSCSGGDCKHRNC